VIRTYSVLSYLAFWLTTGWAALFLADLGGVPSVDGRTGTSTLAALVLDLCLLLLFAVQHTVMARAGAKRRLTRWIDERAERSTYVLAASGCLALLFWQWRALPDQVWHLSSEPWRVAAWALCAAGWTLALASTVPAGHLAFLGVRPESDDGLVVTGLYSWVRHPMMLGLLVAFWATPDLTVGHLVFAVASTAYVVVGIRFEEHGLRRHFGAAYVDYARAVPALFPRPSRRRAVAEVGPPQRGAAREMGATATAERQAR
jgi:methanethiol S-methyltransferase